jgi:hypothetical protein
MAERKIIIRRFPTLQGDTTIEIAESLLTKEKVFHKGSIISFGNKSYTDWDELLHDIQESKDQTIELLRFKPVVGG